jgi:carboxyl-terminal processing protease
MVDDNVGYIKVSKFAATTYDEFVTAMNRLLQRGMDKLILDLRGNYGGYLQAAIKMADEFLEDETLIVYTKGNSRPKSFAFATGKGMFEHNDIVILVDEGSASASEIVAGAIQDNDRGTIVGRRTFGKGLVQEQLNLPDGSALRLTVARYHTPTGRNIQRPYTNGDDDEYYQEYYHRFMNGEMLSKDSIHFDDSLKFTTPGGKVVYGGGGIMPDIFVPVTTDENLEYYNKLLRNNIIFQFAFDYTDLNRDEFAQYETAKDYKDNYQISEQMLNDLVAYAKEEGIEGKKKDIRASEFRIKTLLKAYMGRNLYDDEGFYPIYHDIDEIFQKGYQALNVEL